MTNTIHAGDNSFEFDNLHLGNPHSLQGGSYFSKILFGPTDECVYIQTPKCRTNKGIIKTGKKEYVDILLTNDNINFIEWMNNLEERIQLLIYEKRDTWFAQAEELEMDDIQAQFTPPIKVYKGTNYLVRCYLHSTRGIVSTLNIFDENQVPKIADDVTNECSIISIIEVQGLRFSQKTFQIDITLKQIMILNNEPMFSNCVINPNAAMKHLVSEDQTVLEDQTENQTENQSVTDVQEVQSVIDDQSVTNDQEVHLVTNDPLVTDDKEIVNVKNDLDINLDPINDFGLEEVTFEESGLQNLDSLTLKKPNEIYYEMYKDAKSKAKDARKKALEMFLKAKQIKDKYALEEMDDSDEDDEMEFLFNNS